MSPDASTTRVWQIQNYLVQIRTALESRNFDVFDQLINDFEPINSTLQAISRDESADVNVLTDLYKDVVNLIDTAERQKRNLAHDMSFLKKKKKNIAAYIKNQQAIQ